MSTITPNKGTSAEPCPQAPRKPATFCLQRGLLLACMVLGSLVPGLGNAQDAGVAVPLKPSALAQIRILENDKAAWTEAERKLDTELLFAIRRAESDPLFDRLPQLRTGLGVSLVGNIEVLITGSTTPSLRDAVSHAGALLDVHPQRGILRARVPLGGLRTLASRADIKSIRRNRGFEVRKVNTSEGDVTHRTNVARGTFQVDGSGIKIGVLSDGVDSLAVSQASGDLPTVNIVPGQAGNGDEGTAMLEIVHDLAPGAELYFATANPSPAQFAANITALANAGCDVIVDDVFYFSEPTFQDGIIAQAAADFAATGGFFFSSAGNSGNRNDGKSGVWEGDFTSDPNVPQSHDFGPTNTDPIVVDSPSHFILQWSDPLGGSANDYDLYMVSPDGSTVLTTSENTQDGNDAPFELIDSQTPDPVTGNPPDHSGNQLVVWLYTGNPRFIWLNSNRGILSQATNGQVSGHSTVVGGFGVAAVDVAAAAGAGGTFNGSESVETFSSDGPRRVFFNRNGAALTPGNFSSTGGTLRFQPRIAAADGVATSAPGFNPFFGTSAAAPHAAAIAALALDLNPNVTPAVLDYAFSQTAMDIEAAGFDRDAGYGLIDAVPLLNYIQSLGGDTIFVDGFEL